MTDIDVRGRTVYEMTDWSFSRFMHSLNKFYCLQEDVGWIDEVQIVMKFSFFFYLFPKEQ
jgi:hypothetical protein